ncbi:hypothetical protein BMJ29_00230 [Sinorhizobium medicae]|uniref:Uncharacterized protein n=1 Tax=Sinorhizobium medicae TaxID=110321 RepID=A0ABX4THB5_9HYPH|nr:hypothetical protein BMJ33_24225 [Sinorhizobium medicae]PLU25443.1 hypothetical protein BMJ29_00230 [Sinorhizobium medicae]PLU77235.1 hypothetical protein BMJ19_25360 [Sinorhizobium medicae]
MLFFSDRLANRVLLEKLFWRDMILFGTTLNLTFLAGGTASGTRPTGSTFFHALSCASSPQAGCCS